MKRAAVLLLLTATLAVYAADDIEAVCQREGGCRLITERAYTYLVGELRRLTEEVARMKKEQCT
jgi:hypothetical protein